jgi:hypothetical protein
MKETSLMDLNTELVDFMNQMEVITIVVGN